jgi:hypothetical protein
LIHKSALPFFRGRHVVIAQHRDDAGDGAGKLWGGQLEPYASRVSILTMPVKDLNDFVQEADSRDVAQWILDRIK